MNPLAPFQSILKSLKGRHHRKYLKKCVPVVEKINRLEKEFQKISDDELKSKTPEMMERYQNGESLEELLPEAFAVVKSVHADYVAEPLMYVVIRLAGKWFIMMFS